MTRRILFKCSFGGKAGWGHVIRCSALADAFRQSGWETMLWGIGSYDELPLDVAAAFSGRSPSGRESSAILVVDEMYTEQGELQTVAEQWRARNSSGVVAGIDDMQGRSMAGFDLVLNTEIGLEEARYESGSVLLGERFALLRKGFQQPSPNIGTALRPEAVPVLLMLGGTDTFGFGRQVLEALGPLADRQIVPIVVAGESVELGDALMPFFESHLLSCVSAAELAAWMARCRLGVFACGSSLYEAAAMNLPFVGLSVVDNQSAAACKVEELWKMPICRCEDGTLPRGEFVDKFARLMDSLRKSYSIVDTKGADRVCEALLRLL